MTAASAEALGVELRAAGISDVTVDDADRAAYSSDASLFRLVPQAVVLPRGEEDVARTLSVARRLGVPVVSRGAGTSIAGNAIGTGIVLDFSRHMNAVLDLDPVEQSAWVEAGMRPCEPAGARPCPRSALRTRPVDPHAVHDRRDDRQQRVRAVGAGLRPHG